MVGSANLRRWEPPGGSRLLLPGLLSGSGPQGLSVGAK